MPQKDVANAGGGESGHSSYLYPHLTAQTIAQAHVPPGRPVRVLMCGGGGPGGRNGAGSGGPSGGGGGGAGAYLDVTIPADVWATITAVNVGDDTGGSVNINGGDCELKAGGTSIVKAGKGTAGTNSGGTGGAGGAGGTVTADERVKVNMFHAGAVGEHGVLNGRGGNGGASPGMGGRGGLGGVAANGSDGVRGGGGGGGGGDGETNRTGGSGGRAFCMVIF